MSIEIPGYRIQHPIAEGGMATVYLAEQESLARLVALKVLKNSGPVTDTERFVHEGRIIASLNHRSIITIHDIGSHGQHRFLSMEYHERGSLQPLIDQGVATEAALELVQTIAECLEFVHRRGIVHRDIKPGNILIRQDGTPVLTDFGVAKDVLQDKSLTMDGMALGSPYYLSPEQALGRTPDRRADLYSLGIVLFELLTGRRPFEGETAMEVIVAHVSQPIPRLPRHLSGYQPLIDGLLAKNPDERPATAQALVEEIARTRAVLSASATRPTPLIIERAVRWLRAQSAPIRYTTAALALGVAVTALGLGTLGGTSQVSAPLVLTSVAAPVDSVADPGGLEGAGPSTTQMASLAGLDLVGPDESDAPPVASHQDTVTALPTNLQAPQDGAPQPDAGSDRHDESQRQERIQAYLARAELALKSYRLTTPAGDNAYHYYAEALSLDPEHSIARQGVGRIADSYARLAQAAIERYEYEEATRYLDRGLSVDPGNRRLQALRARTKPSKDIPFRLRRQLDAWL